MRDLLIAEKRREMAAIKKARADQDDTDDVDVDKLLAERRRQGLAVDML